MKAAQELDWIPDRRPVDNDCGRRYCDADEGIERHGQWESNRLAERLPAFIFGETSEVRDVERDSRPESNRAVQSGNKKFQKIASAAKLRRSGEHGAKAAGGDVSPAEQQQSHGKQNGCT